MQQKLSKRKTVRGIEAEIAALNFKKISLNLETEQKKIFALKGKITKLQNELNDAKKQEWLAQ